MVRDSDHVIINDDANYNDFFTSVTNDFIQQLIHDFRGLDTMIFADKIQ